MATPNSPGDYETEYEAGQDNVQLLGLDVHNPVFFAAAVLVLGFCGGVLMAPESAKTAMEAARGFVVETFDWLFITTGLVAMAFCALIAFSPMGRIRLGGPEAEPEFSTKSWLAMLFAAGVGIGMIFYGAAEPLYHFFGNGCDATAEAGFGTPLNVPSCSPEAERAAMAATVFHWGLTPWAIYAVIGLALAFFTFNKGLPLTIRSAFYPILGERVWGWPGHIIDTVAVIATLFGLATSLGIGATQAAAGIENIFGIENTITTQALIIAGITCLAIISVVRGLDGGVKVLSNINMILAALLLVFIVTVGPTLRIFESAGANVVEYFRKLPALNVPAGRDDEGWYHGWTIFYWAWWISWSPFVGMFIARVSKGRTIRQFLAAVLLVPLVVVTIWFSAFGETAFYQVENQIGDLANGIGTGEGQVQFELILFELLAQLPYAEISSILAIVLLIVFFVTSSDSGSLVIDSITAGGKLHAPVPQRIFWAGMEGLVAIALLLGAGGTAALGALQAGATAAGLPFAVVLLLTCFSLFKGLRSEVNAIAASPQTG